jgi:7,8-dihydropterin-6-yl-methyl-4-(beta-D-ribofuranosyl)aminobenzene 5'-phosphate synthase
LILEGKQGLILVCGCCHAGLLNTLAHVRGLFNSDITAIVGGTHLVSLDSELLRHTIESLRNLNASGYLPELFLNHCTGKNALAALSQAFGEKVRPCPAGTSLAIE